MNSRTALIALLFAALGAGIWWSQRPTAVELIHPDVPAEAWTAYVTQVKASPPPDAEPLLAAFVAANRAEAAAGPMPINSADYLRAAQALERAAWNFIQLRPPADFLRVGRYQGLQLIERLRAFLAECAQRGTQPADALAAAQPSKITQAYIDAGGAFVHFAEAGGFIRDGALVETHLPFLQALFIDHWISPLNHQRPMRSLLESDEHRWLLQWKVEWQSAGDLDRRVAAADRLAKSRADYPAQLNAGVLLYHAGRYADAAERFTQSAHPRAQAYLRQAQAH